MRYTEVAPSPRLAWLVERYWMLEGRASGAPDVIIPDGRVEIVFHYAGAFFRHDALRSAGAAQRQPGGMVVGQMLVPVLLTPQGRVGVAAARLRPAAARALLGFALTDIGETFVDVEQLFPSAAQLRERLSEPANNDASRVALLEAWLTACLSHRPWRSRLRASSAAPSASSSSLDDGLDIRVAATVRGIVASGGRASIDALASHTDLHVRQLERRFLHDVGLTPKTFARICRLQAALRCIRDGVSLSDTAVRCGFYDQAHMARDLRLLASMSPRAWQKHAGELAPLFVSGDRADISQGHHPDE